MHGETRTKHSGCCVVLSALGGGGWCSAWWLSQLQAATYGLGWSLSALEGLLRPKCGGPYAQTVLQSSWLPCWGTTLSKQLEAGYFPVAAT